MRRESRGGGKVSGRGDLGAAGPEAGAEFNFHGKLRSAIAGMRFWNFDFQWFPQTIRRAQGIEFLGHRQRHLRETNKFDVRELNLKAHQF